MVHSQINYPIYLRAFVKGRGMDRVPVRLEFMVVIFEFSMPIFQIRNTLNLLEIDFLIRICDQ